MKFANICRCGSHFLETVSCRILYFDRPEGPTAFKPIYEGPPEARALRADLNF